MDSEFETRNTVECSICGEPLDNPGFARRYPGMVCRRCDERAVNAEGAPAHHESQGDGGDNPVFIDGIKCWRRYRFGGFVTMRDLHDSETLDEFYEKQLTV